MGELEAWEFYELMFRGLCGWQELDADDAVRCFLHEYERYCMGLDERRCDG